MRRAFSLLELILCMALASILIMAVAYNLRGPRYKTQSQGAAEVIAQEFRTARQTAMTSRMPVAIAFPSSGGSNPCTQSYYTLQGFEKPQVVRSRQFHGEFPHARIFNGYWPLDPSQLLDSGAGLTAANPRVGSSYDTFDPNLWGSPNPKDFTLVFMPDGSVRSNGMPMFDSAYHVVVCNEVAYAGAANPAGAPPGGVSYYSLTRVATPYTISIGTLGAVQVEKGLTALNAGTVAIIEGSSEFKGAAPPPPTADSSTPTVASLEMLPVPIAANLPSGTSAAVAPGDYLTLVAYANDSQGGPLYCSWNCSGGQFSGAGNVTMDWVESIGRWRAVGAWAPPPNAPGNAQYDVSVRIEDRAGHSVTAGLGSTGKAGIAQAGKIVYSSYRGNEQEICQVRPDGTRAVRYFHSLDEEFSTDANPVLSPDGSKIAFTSDRTGDSEVFVMNADGTGLINVSNDPNEDLGPITWAPDGTRVCWTSDRIPSTTWAWNLFCARPDGSQLVALTNEVIGNECRTPSWSPDGAKIAYQFWDFDNTGNDQIVCMTLNTSGGGIASAGQQLVSNNNSASVYANADGPPSWNPNSTVVAWTDDRDYQNDPAWNTGIAVYKGNVNGSGITRLTTTDGMLDCMVPVWSPDGSKLAHQRMDWNSGQQDVYVMNVDGTNPTAVTNDPSLDILFWTYLSSATAVPIAWSPTSQELCFLSYANGSTDLYRCLLNGTSLLQITQHELDDIGGPDSPTFSWGSQ